MLMEKSPLLWRTHTHKCAYTQNETKNKTKNMQTSTYPTSSKILHVPFNLMVCLACCFSFLIFIFHVFIAFLLFIFHTFECFPIYIRCSIGKTVEYMNNRQCTFCNSGAKKRPENENARKIFSLHSYSSTWFEFIALLLLLLLLLHPATVCVCVCVCARAATITQ